MNTPTQDAINKALEDLDWAIERYEADLNLIRQRNDQAWAEFDRALKAAKKGLKNDEEK